MIEKVLFENEIMISSLKALPLEGVFIVRFGMVEPFDGSSKELTTGALVINDDNQIFDPPMFIVDDFENNSQKMLLDISRGFVDAGIRPEIIVYADDDTKQLLEDYCSKIETELLHVDEFVASETFFDRFSKYDDDEYDDWEDEADGYELSDEERLDVIIQALMMYSDEEIRSMEPEFINEAKDLVNLHAFPPELEKEFRRKLGMDGEA